MHLRQQEGNIARRQPAPLQIALGPSEMHRVTRRGAAQPGRRARPFIPLARPLSPPTPITNIKGLYLLADYPAITMQRGTTATVNLKLRNYMLAPEPARAGSETVTSATSGGGTHICE
jgi:hypothetical protein